jgi:hypothetical protein
MTFDPGGRHRIVVAFFGKGEEGKTFAEIFSLVDMENTDADELNMLRAAMTAALIRWLVYGAGSQRVH